MNNLAEQTLFRTPLFDEHVALGGRLVPFAGWELPVRYTDVAEEHRVVRERVGLFDVSHMGEFEVKGPDAEAVLDYLTCNAVKSLKNGRAQYSAFLNEQGGVEDDIIVYRYSAEHYLLCVNAANSDADFEWVTSKTKAAEQNFDCTWTNRSAEFGQIAVQGPKAVDVLERLLPEAGVRDLRYFSFMTTDVCGAETIIARTGYTGEDGFELFIPWDSTAAVWRALLETGAPEQIAACGLGARDSLRLEACYPLHGHELAPDVTAIESGLGWIVKPAKKGEFIGKSVVAPQKEQGAPRTLVGFFVTDKGIVREGASVFNAEGKEIGTVTSGTKTPTVGKALGLALIDSASAAEGTTIIAQVRSRKLACEIVPCPFYSRPRS